MSSGIMASQQRYDIDAANLFNRAFDLGFTQPSFDNKELINSFIIAAKSAGDGTLNGYIDIRIYMTDIAGTGLQNFDSIHWNNPNATRVASDGNVTKIVKKGYSTTLDSGTLISNTLIDTSVELNRRDFACFWIWLDVETPPTSDSNRASGISIGSDTRSLLIYPKYSSTNGYLGYAGRVADYTQSNGNTIAGMEVVGTTVANSVVRFYRNNTEVSSQTNNWAAFTDFNSNMLDLTINISATPTTVGIGFGRINSPFKIGGCVIYRPSIVNRTSIYNALNNYMTSVLAL